MEADARTENFYDLHALTEFRALAKDNGYGFTDVTHRDEGLFP